MFIPLTLLRAVSDEIDLVPLALGAVSAVCGAAAVYSHNNSKPSISYTERDYDPVLKYKNRQYGSTIGGEEDTIDLSKYI